MMLNLHQAKYMTVRVMYKKKIAHHHNMVRNTNGVIGPLSKV